jgi:RND family efflux transporter MFP subunit
MKKSIIVTAILVTLVGVITYTLAKNKKKIEANKVVVDRSKQAVAVSTVAVDYKAYDGKVLLPANLELNNEATIAIGVQGKIEKLSIEVGSRVAKGQVIGNLDSKLKLINLKANELTLSKLQNDLTRNEDLFKGNAGTELNVINNKYDIENTRLQIEQVKQQITDGNIISPISGIVTSRKLMAGEFVSPGTVIATIVDDVHLKAVVYINEKDVYQIRLGQSATISSDVFPNKTFAGTVKFISPKGDENHNYRVELQFNTNQLRAGTYVMVGFDLGGKAKVLQIPKLALAEGVKNPYVYVVKNNVASVRPITLGREIGENIEVVAGLEAGEEVVTSGQINLTDGSSVLKTTNK